jgi:hypothetical protein
MLEINRIGKRFLNKYLEPKVSSSLLIEKSWKKY